MKQNADSKAI